MADRFPNPAVQNASVFYDTMSSQKGFVNVKAFGAIGNGTHDDTEAIIAAKTSIIQHGGTLFFPAGFYLVTREIDLGNKYGLKVMGCGAGYPPSDSISTNYNSTVILWQGPDGHRVFVTGSVNMAFEDFSIWGRWTSASVDIPRAGIVVRRHTDVGIPTGKVIFKGISVADCDVGIQIGDPDDPVHQQVNGDHIILDQVRFRDCDVGYKTTDEQNLEHYARDVMFDSCKVGYFFSGGGRLNAQGVWQANTQNSEVPIILQVAKDEVSGSNASYVINGLYLDGNNIAGRPRLYVREATSSSPCHVRISNLVSQNQILSGDEPLFTIHGNDYVILEGAYGVGSSGLIAEANSPGAQESTLIIRDSYVFGGVTGQFAETGTFYWASLNNHNGSGGDSLPEQGSRRGVNQHDESTILNGNTFLTVSHTIGYTPREVFVTPKDSDTSLYVSNVGATSFRVNRSSSSGDLDFYWMAIR